MRNIRRRLPDERASITHKFTVAGHEGYVTASTWPEDGTVGEIVITMSKEGSTLAGLMDSFATAISIGLQHNVSLATFCNKFKHTRFEPSGYTPNEDIRFATSIIDYIFRWLELKFLKPEVISEPIAQTTGALSTVIINVPTQANITARINTDAPICTNCGGLTKRSGSCYCCQNCGTTTGCS